MSAINTKHSCAASSLRETKSSNVVRNARCREMKAFKLELLVDELNAKRAHPRTSLKGMKKPKYSPPTSMSQEETKEWKNDARLKRKAARQREARKEKLELIKGFIEQLAVLDKIIEDQNKGFRIILKPDGSLDYDMAESMDGKRQKDETPKLKSIEAPNEVIAGLQTSQSVMDSSIVDGLDDIEFESFADGNHVSTGTFSTVDPINLMFDPADIRLDDIDDSFWADGDSIHFDVPIKHIFDDDHLPDTSDDVFINDIL